MHGPIHIDMTGRQATSRADWKRSIRAMAQEAFRITRPGGVSIPRIWPYLRAREYDWILKCHLDSGWGYAFTVGLDPTFDGAYWHSKILDGRTWELLRDVDRRVAFNVFVKPGPDAPETFGDLAEKLLPVLNQGAETIAWDPYPQ